MNKKIAFILMTLIVFCFCSCNDSTMSYEEYLKYSKMEEELEQYHNLDEYHILTEDDQSEWYKALTEKYGEDTAEDVVDLFYSNTHKLYMNID